MQNHNRCIMSMRNKIVYLVNCVAHFIMHAKWDSFITNAIMVVIFTCTLGLQVNVIMYKCHSIKYQTTILALEISYGCIP